MQSVQFMEACATSLFGEPEYSGLGGVGLRATLGVALWAARVSFLFDNGGRCGGRSVDPDVYPFRAFLGSAGGIVGLCVLHC